jgi:hypothetical protein
MEIIDCDGELGELGLLGYDDSDDELPASVIYSVWACAMIPFGPNKL